jgi:hypothetical protein
VAEPVAVPGEQDRPWPARLLRWSVERVLTQV